MYGVTGGFYHSKYFKRWIKFSWTVTSLLAYFIIVIVGCGGYWLTTDNIPSGEIIHLLVISIINTVILILIPAFSYCHRYELETILDLDLDEKWKHEGLSRKIECEIATRRKRILLSISSNLLVILVLVVLQIFEKFILKSSKGIGVLEHYYPVPWLHKINSYNLFLLIFIIHSACMMVQASIAICWNPFFVLLVSQIYDALSITCDRMHQFSRQAEYSFEKTYEKFSCSKDEPTLMFGNRGSQFAEEKKNIAMHCELEFHRSRLLRNVLISAKEHQLLRR